MKGWWLALWLAPALVGSDLGIADLVVLIAGALPHVATLPISDRYHAPWSFTNGDAPRSSASPK